VAVSGYPFRLFISATLILTIKKSLTYTAMYMQLGIQCLQRDGRIVLHVVNLIVLDQHILFYTLA